MKLEPNLGKLDLGQSGQKNGLNLENIGDRVHNAITMSERPAMSETSPSAAKSSIDPKDVLRQIAGINPQPMPGLLYNSVV